MKIVTCIVFVCYRSSLSAQSMGQLLKKYVILLGNYSRWVEKKGKKSYCHCFCYLCCVLCQRCSELCRHVIFKSWWVSSNHRQGVVQCMLYKRTPCIVRGLHFDCSERLVSGIKCLCDKMHGSALTSSPMSQYNGLCYITESMISISFCIIIDRRLWLA